jgi:putative hydrolase of the HAD superfamily
LQTYHQHECGEINFYEFYRNVSEQLNLNLSEQHFLEGWNKIFLGLMPGIEALLKSIPEMIPKYVFSNTNVTHEQVWREKYSGVLRHFRQIYTSVELGMRKPDHAAYREVLSRIGAKPEQVLFFDDSRENIIGAREYGIESVLVQSSDDIKKALKRYQLL